MIIALMLLTRPQSESNRWLPPAMTFLLAALAAASALFWVLHWPVRASPSRFTVTATPTLLIDSGKVALLLGAKTAPDKTPLASLQSTSKLLGVIAQGGSGSRGSALIAVQGAPAKPYQVGDIVADGLVLLTIKPRSVVLGPEGQSEGTVTLELPPLPGMPGSPVATPGSPVAAPGTPVAARGRRAPKAEPTDD